MANPTQARERRSREELVPQMRKASDWLLADASRKVQEALQKFDVPYSSFWLFHFRRANPTLVTPQAQIDKMGEAAWANKIADMRDNQHLSWGEIAARWGDGDFGISESKIRSMYSRATNKHHQGTRIGHGGRFLGGVEYHELLYRAVEGEPDRKRQGTVLEPGTKAYEAAQKIMEERQARQVAAAKQQAKKRPAKKAAPAKKAPAKKATAAA